MRGRMVSAKARGSATGSVAVHRQLGRVHEGAVLRHAEVQVGTGRQPRGADETDDVLLLHLHADVETTGVTRQVVVAGLQPVRMRENDGVARAALHSHLHHAPRGRRPHRRPHRRRVVDAQVSLLDVQDGMEPFAIELRADSDEPERRLQQALRQGLAALVVVLARPFAERRPCRPRRRRETSPPCHRIRPPAAVRTCRTGRPGTASRRSPSSDRRGGCRCRSSRPRRRARPRRPTRAVDSPAFCTDSYSDESTTPPAWAVFTSTADSSLRAVQVSVSSSFRRGSGGRRRAGTRSSAGVPSSPRCTRYFWPPRMVRRSPELRQGGDHRRRGGAEPFAGEHLAERVRGIEDRETGSGLACPSASVSSSGGGANGTWTAGRVAGIRGGDRRLGGGANGTRMTGGAGASETVLGDATPEGRIRGHGIRSQLCEHRARRVGRGSHRDQGRFGRLVRLGRLGTFRRGRQRSTGGLEPPTQTQSLAGQRGPPAWRRCRTAAPLLSATMIAGRPGRRPPTLPGGSSPSSWRSTGGSTPPGAPCGG